MRGFKVIVRADSKADSKADSRADSRADSNAANIGHISEKTLRQRFRNEIRSRELYGLGETRRFIYEILVETSSLFPTSLEIARKALAAYRTVNYRSFAIMIMPSLIVSDRMGGAIFRYPGLNFMWGDTLMFKSYMTDSDIVKKIRENLEQDDWKQRFYEFWQEYDENVHIFGIPQVAIKIINLF